MEEKIRKPPGKGNAKGWKSYIKWGVGRLRQFADGVPRGGMSWSDILTMASLSDPSGEIKSRALSAGIIALKRNNIEIIAEPRLERHAGGKETREMNAAKKTPEKTRTYATRRMRVQNRARAFWDMLKTRDEKFDVGSEVNLDDKDIGTLTGYEGHPEYVPDFCKRLVAAGMAQWKDEKTITVVRNPHDIPDEQFQEVRAAADIALPAVLTGKAGTDLKKRQAALARKEAEVRAKREALERDVAELAEKRQQLKAEVKAEERTAKGFHKEAARVRTRFDKLSVGGKRAFFSEILANEEGWNLVVGLIDEFTSEAGSQPPKASPAKPKKK